MWTFPGDFQDDPSHSSILSFCRAYIRKALLTDFIFIRHNLAFINPIQRWENRGSETWWFAPSHFPSQKVAELVPGRAGLLRVLWIALYRSSTELQASGSKIYLRHSLHPEPSATSTPPLTRSPSVSVWAPSSPRVGLLGPRGRGTARGYLGWPPAGWLKFKLWSSQLREAAARAAVGKGRMSAWIISPASPSLVLVCIENLHVLSKWAKSEISEPKYFRYLRIVFIFI